MGARSRERPLPDIQNHDLWTYIIYIMFFYGDIK